MSPIEDRLITITAALAVTAEDVVLSAHGVRGGKRGEELSWK
jgi:hypothetical protein